jgi:hypothetical protein
MRAINFPLSILPGKQESWRRCLQELLEVYRSDYDVLRHQLGMTSKEEPTPGGRLWV